MKFIVIYPAIKNLIYSDFIIDFLSIFLLVYMLYNLIRERLHISSAEGATTPETLRQKDRTY